MYLESPWFFSNQAMSISLSKCPMLQTIVLSFIASKCFCPTMLQLPVAVTTISTIGMAVSKVSTWKPSIAACNAQIGSTSVTMTLAPAPRKDSAEPLPTSP